jgi:hypothetical protein
MIFLIAQYIFLFLILTRCVYVPIIDKKVDIGYGGSIASSAIPGSAKWTEKKMNEMQDGEDDNEADEDRALVILSACPTPKWSAITLANPVMRTAGAHYPRVFMSTMSPIMTAFHCDPKSAVFGSAFQKMGIGQGLKCDGVTLVSSCCILVYYFLNLVLLFFLSFLAALNGLIWHFHVRGTIRQLFWRSEA